MAKVKTLKKDELYKDAPYVSPRDAHPKLREYFGFCFHRCAAQFRRLTEEQVSKLGLVPPHMAVLGVLNVSGPLNQNQLGTQTAIDKATMVKLLDSLEEGGFVKRTPGEKDRRINLIELTPKGSRVLAKLAEIRDDVEQSFFATLSKTEQSQLRAIMRKLADHL